MSVFRDLEYEVSRYYSMRRREFYEANNSRIPSVATGSLYVDHFIVDETNFILTIFPTILWTVSMDDPDAYIPTNKELLMVSLAKDFLNGKDRGVYGEFRIFFTKDLKNIEKIKTWNGSTPPYPTPLEMADYLGFHFGLSGIRKILNGFRMLNIAML